MRQCRTAALAFPPSWSNGSANWGTRGGITASSSSADASRWSVGSGRTSARRSRSLPALGRYSNDAFADFVRHLGRFPHLARLVWVLKIEFNWNSKEDVVHPLCQLLERCRQVSKLMWCDKTQFLPLALPSFPRTTLTCLNLGSLHTAWDPSLSLRLRPELPRLRALTLRADGLTAHPGPPVCAPSGVPPLPLHSLTLEFSGYNCERRFNRFQSFARIEALILQRFFRFVQPTSLTSFVISFHSRKLGGVSKFVSACVNLQSLIAWMQDDDMTPYTERLTSMLASLRQLRQLKLYGESTAELMADMSEAEEALHAVILAAFLDSLPATLVELRVAIWAPAGDCCGVLKAFLRCRLFGSPLLSATLHSATRVARRQERVAVQAIKQRLGRTAVRDGGRGLTCGRSTVLLSAIRRLRSRRGSVRRILCRLLYP